MFFLIYSSFLLEKITSSKGHFTEEALTIYSYWSSKVTTTLLPLSFPQRIRGSLYVSVYQLMSLLPLIDIFLVPQPTTLSTVICPSTSSLPITSHYQVFPVSHPLPLIPSPSASSYHPFRVCSRLLKLFFYPFFSIFHFPFLFSFLLDFSYTHP